MINNYECRHAFVRAEPRFPTEDKKVYVEQYRCLQRFGGCGTNISGRRLVHNADTIGKDQEGKRVYWRRTI